VAKIVKLQEAITKTEGNALYWAWSIQNTNLMTASLACGNRNLKNEHTRGQENSVPSVKSWSVNG